MDFKQLLQNKTVLYGIIGVVVVVLVTGVMAVVVSAGGQSES